MTMNLLAICSSLLAMGLFTVFAASNRQLVRVKVVAKPRDRRIGRN
jgi:hypothetical protein